METLFKILLLLIGKLGLLASKGTLASFWFAYEPELPKNKNEKQ
ncbi:AgrD family cyclic lactone autoinducer peptide [Sediminibacillus albus]|uniref:Cyclic lactone autoinducer peptide n=1 Tax=Sediminibacillus albus TaxID=407036 RepID=A0A1G9A3A9_9BACI|nr:cyclic lactone autoinducer peptide [Sediminibacillus albus]SDK21869.1 cyclic lactone autoinducer peptide [Sediminibacillus albus]